jgi:hypothetical protein
LPPPLLISGIYTQEKFQKVKVFIFLRKSITWK